MKRRLFAMTLLASSALAGCATGGKISFVSAAKDVATIAQAFATIIPQVGALGNVPQSTLTTLTGYVNDLAAAAKTLASAGSADDARTTVEKVETYVNAFIGIAAGLPLPPPFPTYLAAAAVLLPVLEAAVGLVTGSANAPAAKRAAAGAPAMVPEQARAMLLKAAL